MQIQNSFETNLAELFPLIDGLTQPISSLFETEQENLSDHNTEDISNSRDSSNQDTPIVQFEENADIASEIFEPDRRNVVYQLRVPTFSGYNEQSLSTTIVSGQQLDLTFSSLHIPFSLTNLALVNNPIIQNGFEPNQVINGSEFSSTVEIQPVPIQSEPAQPDPTFELPITPPVATRDPLKQPFASNSIWNMPIGSNAVYVDANIGAASRLGVDVDFFEVLDGNESLKPVYARGVFGPGRPTGTRYQNIALPLPDDYLIPDATNTRSPNNAGAFLMPDQRTLAQFGAMARDREGGNLFGFFAGGEDIYGDGIRGVGGSGTICHWRDHSPW